MDSGSWLTEAISALIATGLAWWNNVMWSELKENRRKIHDQNGEINKLQILVAGSYVTREEFQRSLASMTGEIRRGFDKVDSQLGDLYDEVKTKAKN